MISKHISNPEPKSEKHRRIIGLIRYILNPAKDNEKEKCVYDGARCFITEDRATQMSEMVALSEDAVRSKNTVEHFVLSWREGEKPNIEQIEELVSIWQKEMGLDGCQIIYGLHEDTDNYHLHIAVNRFHPEALQCIKINGGFTREAEHRAIALIENAQGWKPEKQARYTVISSGKLAYNSENGDVVPDSGWSADIALKRKQTDERKKQRSQQLQDRRELEENTNRKNKYEWQAAIAALKEKHINENNALKINQKNERFALRGQLPASRVRINVAISQKAADIETRTGVKSAERVAKEIAGPILRKSSNWLQLHEQLAAVGCRFEKKGSGALVWVCETPIKASAACQKSSFSKLEKRLGAYQPAPENLPMATRALEPIKADAPKIGEYTQQRSSHEAERAREHEALRRRQKRERDAAWQLYEEQRDALLLGLEGPPRYAFRIVIRARWLAHRDEIQKRHGQEKRMLQRRMPAFLGVEDWLRDRDEPGLAELWRHRNSGIAMLVGNTDSPAMPGDIRDFIPQVLGRQVSFWRCSADAPAFVDFGKRIEISAADDREAACAALQLAKAKWGSVTVSGSPEFQQMILELAAELHVQIENPELQERMQLEVQSYSAAAASESDQALLKQLLEFTSRLASSQGAAPAGGQGVAVVDELAQVVAASLPEEEAESFQRYVQQEQSELDAPDAAPDDSDGPGW